jgi:hypothetical protein
VVVFVVLFFFVLMAVGMLRHSPLETALRASANPDTMAEKPPTDYPIALSHASASGRKLTHHRCSGTHLRAHRRRSESWPVVACRFLFLPGVRLVGAGPRARCARQRFQEQGVSARVVGETMSSLGPVQQRGSASTIPAQHWGRGRMAEYNEQRRRCRAQLCCDCLASPKWPKCSG